MTEFTPIAEMDNFIILNEYTKIKQTNTGHQSEAQLEKEFINDLQNQGYEYVKDLTTPTKMLANARIQIQNLNDVEFTDAEWQRFCDEYFHKTSDGHLEKTKKIHEDYIYDFTFDNGRIQNIYLVDKKNLTKNKLQVISQFEQTGKHKNRYDVTILVNGIPLVHVELKKRGTEIKQAYYQVNRYSKESFNSENSLYKYLQIFVISNGTYTRYFANTTKRDKNSYDFTMEWADFKNKTITDLKDFTETFFQRNTMLKVLLQYSVFDASENLLIMRPYQIAATERIMWKIHSCHHAKQYKAPENGGFIWHTTGSGKTLTSFKAARMATELDFIDKVFFVVDRKDLDFQTMKEYQKFSKDSVNGSTSTAELRKNINKDDNKIIVTTIQKLNNLIKGSEELAIYKKPVVFIFDECHRSQFGEAQRNIVKKFKQYYQFGFTGTPIFEENAIDFKTTASVFGYELHTYIITDAIRDNKVLKFMVDYHEVSPHFKNAEMEQDEEKLNSKEIKAALQHPDRIEKVSRYILDNFNAKTHRFMGRSGFNAMFAVSDITSAKLYYEAITNLQKNNETPLKIATIFSYTANEEQSGIGEIRDETFEPTAMEQSSKEFLNSAINDYNTMFKTNFSIDNDDFQNYYKDLANRMKNREIDLLIVVGMFLTGFDAPRLNTLFVDKNLKYHGLIQAYSRTNRIYDSTKSFGNIVTFRNLEQATEDAIKRFGDSSIAYNIVIEKSFDEYMNGFEDTLTDNASRGYKNIVEELNEKFADISGIVTDQDKNDFVKLFGEYLKVENILQNYDKFTHLKALQFVDREDQNAMEEFKALHNISDEVWSIIQELPVLEQRQIQDYRSAYNDIYDHIKRERAYKEKEETLTLWDNVVFEVELLKSQEINVDYILGLTFEKNKQLESKEELIEEITSVVRSSIGNRAKQSLIIDFIEQTDLDKIEDKETIIDEFYAYAKIEKSKELDRLIEEEGLKREQTLRYIASSLKNGFASDVGTDLIGIMPPMSPLNPQTKIKKRSVFEKISDFVEKFIGIEKMN